MKNEYIWPLLLLAGTLNTCPLAAQETLRGEVKLIGSATEHGQSVTMNELTPNGQHTGVYEAYMKAKPGEFAIMSVSPDSKDTLWLGRGNTEHSVKRGGKPFASSSEQVVRVRFDSRHSQLGILPVTLCLKGNIVKDGTQMTYAGNGVWRSQVEMNSGDVFLFSDKFFYFALNGQDSLAIKRLTNDRRSVGMPSEGYQAENIRINRGTYTLTLNMNQRTWDIDAPIREYRISAFGSSVCNGEGAYGHRGYAYMYGQQLADRYRLGQSPTPFEVSGVSIGGNSTVALLHRYDELIHDFGRYVIIGLSLGNEGIHGAKDQQAVFDQFHRNMLTLIDKCRRDGKVPVVMNNYTRGDYNLSDYGFVKRMNLDIHRWQVPSVNVLGAIDNGEGKWADGYMRDTYHQDTKGHREFMFAIPPSLFDALLQGKPYPTRQALDGLSLRRGATIQFCGEGTLHPFTVTLRVKGNKPGRLMTISTSQGEAQLSIERGGIIRYNSVGRQALCSDKTRLTSSDTPYDITLTHYYAQQRTLIYVDGQLAGELKERMEPVLFTVGDSKRNTSRHVSEISLWRSAMTPEEILLHHEGECMKSSLEIYAPLSEEMKTGSFPNLAQSLNSSLHYQSASKRERRNGHK